MGGDEQGKFIHCFVRFNRNKSIAYKSIKNNQSQTKDVRIWFFIGEMMREVDGIPFAMACNPKRHNLQAEPDPFLRG